MSLLGQVDWSREFPDEVLQTKGRSRSEPRSHQVAVRHCGESFDQVGFDSPELKLGPRGARVKLSVQLQGLPSSEDRSEARLGSESVDMARSFSLLKFWLSDASHRARTMEESWGD